MISSSKPPHPPFCKNSVRGGCGWRSQRARPRKRQRARGAQRPQKWARRGRGVQRRERPRLSTRPTQQKRGPWRGLRPPGRDDLRPRRRPRLSARLSSSGGRIRPITLQSSRHYECVRSLALLLHKLGRRYDGTPSKYATRHSAPTKLCWVGQNWDGWWPILDHPQ